MTGTGESRYAEGTVGRLVEEMGERRAYTYIVAKSMEARMAAGLLYKAHQKVIFDTPQDEESKQRVLAEARDLLGYDPSDVGGPT